MKLVILAAGKGTRMFPFTESFHKSLIPIANKPFLYYLLKNIAHAGFKDILIVVGFKSNDLTAFVKEYGFNVTFVEQKEQLGTAHALACCKGLIDDDFVVLMADMLYSSADIKSISKLNGNVAGFTRVNDPSRFGVFELNGNAIVSVEEKPESPKSNFASMALYRFTPEIFDYINKTKLDKCGEYLLTDSINFLIKGRKLNAYELKGDILDFGSPWHILELNSFILKSLKGNFKGNSNVSVAGEVFVGKNVVFKGNNIIEGPVIIGDNCRIGPNSFIRPSTSIGGNCHIGSSEIKNSVIMSNTNIPHFSYVGDSVIGRNCNLGAGTIVANLRLDESNIRVLVKGKLVDTGLRKLGVFMGDNCKVAINHSFNRPGIIIPPNSKII